MDAYFSTPIGPFNTAIGASFTTFTTRQFCDPLPVPVIPAGVLRPGSRLKIEAEGEYGCTLTPTLILGFGMNPLGATGAISNTTPTVLAESSAITLASGATAFGFRMEYRGIVVGVGTAGSIVGVGTLEYDSTGVTVRANVPIPISAALRTVVIDTTLPRPIGVLATFSASNAANRVQVYNCTALLQN
jgi:hypothetical protein